MKRFNSFFMMAGTLFLGFSFSIAQQYVDKRQQQNVLESFLGTPSRALLNINNMSSWQYNDGRSGVSPNGFGGVIYPRATANMVYQDGFIWGGITQDPNLPQLRVGGQTYRVGTQGGKIISTGVPEDPNAPHVRIYKVRMDYLTLTHSDLIQEAAEFFMVDPAQVTQEMTDSLKSQYARDWNEWPVQSGAPFYDLNNNGIYEPQLGEEPGLANADQVIWFVCNDLNQALTYDLYGSMPIGLELQVTIWGYDLSSGTLGQGIFRRYRVINKSGYQIDSMYVAQWSDPDVGDFTNDVVGCDSLMDLGYGYNGFPTDSEFDPFGLAPPAIGYSLLQGPIVPGAPGDTAIFNFKRIPGYQNIPMTSFGYFSAANPEWQDPQLGQYNGTLEWYNLLRGFVTDTSVHNPTPFTHRNTGRSTKFPLNGDPLTVMGDVDGQGANFSPGDRRIAVCSGPFVMSVGDTQEVVFAMFGGLGATQLQSVGQMKLTIQNIRNLANDLLTKIALSQNSNIPQDYLLRQNYPNPFNPTTTIEFSVPHTEFVTLKIYNLLGEEVATLVSDRLTAGTYKYEWSQTGGVASGIYFYRFQAGDFVRSRKMVLLK
jgi:hypothetical protein